MTGLRLRHFTAIAVLGFVSASLLAQPSPRTFTSTFFFGDSLSDSGNTFTLTGSPPAPYFNGRFSNGPTYAEYLVPTLQKHTTAAPTVTTNLNFAFGGATAAPGSLVPNLGLQLGMFSGPASAGGRALTPKSTDLFVVLAGANDVLNYLGSTPTPSGAGVEAAANTAANAVKGAVSTLLTAGAKNILVMNLPDISKTPRFTTGSAAAAASLAQNGSFAFNSTLRGGLGAMNLGADVRLTLVDLGALLNTILANSSRLGFTVTNQEVVGILSSGGNPGDINGYVFWDGIHPTTKTHALLASALNETLNPEFVLGTAATQSTALLMVADLAADTVDSRLDQIRGSTARHHADGFIGYNYKEGGRDADGYMSKFDYKASVLTAGFDVAVTKVVTVGFAFSAEDVSANLKPAAGSFKVKGQTGTAFMQWKNDGPVFLELSGSYGSNDFRKITRATALGGLTTTGRTDAKVVAGSAKIGASFDVDRAHLTPFVGLRFVHADLDGYTESGVGGLNFSYDDQSAKSFTALVGLSADWRTHLGDMPIVIGVSGVYQNDMEDNGQRITGRLADTFATTTGITAGRNLDSSVKVGAHLSGSFSQRWSWTLGGGAEMRSDGDTGRQFSFSLQTGF
ncbi:MAG: autotransporter domain-containing protein [Opitutae bacterium]|nr:autotransporter domain-containing protein [Opitutae bacterium]